MMIAKYMTMSVDELRNERTRTMRDNTLPVERMAWQYDLIQCFIELRFAEDRLASAQENQQDILTALMEHMEKLP